MGSSSFTKGWKKSGSEEIAATLHISLKTVDAHKRSIYNSLCVRNENEVIRVAIYLRIIDPKELDFYGRDFLLNPRPEKEKGD
jgi:hypothetical protein